VPFAVTQRAFRFYNDDGSESASTAAAAQDTNVTITEGGGNQSFHLRIGLQETGGTSGNSTDDWQLQYSKNGGAWTNVTTTSSNVKAFDSANLMDSGGTTNRLTGGTGAYNPGKISEDGLLDDLFLLASRHTEFLYAIQTIDADLAATDTLDFRVLYNGATTGVTYSVTPRITNQVGGATLTAESGSFTLTGTAASLLRGSKLAADAASFALSGTAAGLLRSYIFPVDAGAFTLTGTAAELKRGYAMSAEAAAFTLSGTAASLLRTYIMPVDAGSFSLTGTDALLKRAFSMIAGGATFRVEFTDLLTHYDRAYVRNRRRRRKVIDYGQPIWRNVGR